MHGTGPTSATAAKDWVACAIALLAVCGQGFGTVAAAQPAAPSATSSAPCFPDHVFHAGTVIDHDMSITGDGGPLKSRLRSQTTGTETFAGVTATQLRNDGLDAGGQVRSTGYSYMTRGDGFYSVHGTRFDQDITTIDPPRRMKTAMEPGEVYTQQFTTTARRGGGSTATTKEKLTTTYAGRERYTGPLGTFEACKIVQVQEISGGASGGYTIRNTTWHAAEGPYAGLSLGYVVHGSYPRNVTVNQKGQATRVHAFTMN